MYLNHVSSQQQEQQQQHLQQQSESYHQDAYSVASLQQQHAEMLATQQAALYNGSSNDFVNGFSLEQQQYSGLGAGLNGYGTTASSVGGLLAPANANLNVARGQHARALSMPIFSQGPTQNASSAQAHHQPHHQHQHSGLVGMHSGFGGFGGSAGFGNGGFGSGSFGNGAAATYGLAIQGEGGLSGWAEEEAGA